MIDWDKNLAVIVQDSNPYMLTGREHPGNDIDEFYNQALGHAVMVLKVDSELHYKGYRFSIEGEKELRKLREDLHTNAQVRHLPAKEVREKIGRLKDILRKGRRGKGVQAEIWDEGKRYRPRHQQGLSGTIKDNKLVYYDSNYEKEEVNAIWHQVKQDEEKEKYYSLKPDTVREDGNFSVDALVHNCVTWIVETEHTSVKNPLLPRVEEGNISQFAKKLCAIGGTRGTGEPD